MRNAGVNISEFKPSLSGERERIKNVYRNRGRNKFHLKSGKMGGGGETRR